MKKIIAVAILLCLVLSLTGCSNDQAKQYDGVKGDISIDTSEMYEDNSLSGALVINTSHYYKSSRLYNMIERYKKENPNIDIEVIYEFNDSDDNISYEEMTTRGNSYKKRLISSLMSGDAGDIVLVSDINFDKFIYSGVFKDLNPLIESDEKIDKNEYYTNIWEIGSPDGKLYSIADSFMISAAMINKSVAEKLDFDYTELEQIDPNQLLEIYSTGIENGSIANDTLFYKADVGKNVLLENVFPSYFNAYEKRTDFLDDSFIKYLKLSDNIYTKLTSDVPRVPFGVLEVLPSDKEFLFYRIIPAFAYSEIHSDKQYINAFFDGTDDLSEGIPITTPRGEYIVNNENRMAITENAKNADIAWDFISFYIREESTEEIDVECAYSGFPVNKNDFKKYLMDLTDKSEDELTKITNIAENATLTTNNGNDLDIYGILSDFYDQKLITAEECAEKIQNKAEIYVNE